jgi:hypothetical protein
MLKLEYRKGRKILGTVEKYLKKERIRKIFLVGI